MSDNSAKLAERALVSICVHIALMPCRDYATLGTWSKCLADVLPYCVDCSLAARPLLKAAKNLVAADDGHKRSNRQTRLGYEISLYMASVAGARYEAFQAADLGEVVE